MSDREGKNSLRRGIKTAAGILLLLAVWEAAAKTGIWSAYVLPPPVKVIKALAGMADSGVLFKHIGVNNWSIFSKFATGKGECNN